MKQILTIIIIFLMLISISYAGKRGELKVVFIDVGHGDCILVKTPSGYTVLIDGGIEGKEGKIEKELKKFNITKRINSIILTNPTSEHVGGLIGVVDFYDIGNIYDPGMPFATYIYEKFLELIMVKQDEFGSTMSADDRLTDILTRKNHYEYFNPRAGDILNWGPDVVVTVLSPYKLYHNTRSDPNNNSIVIKLVYNKVSFLFTGNVEKDAERYLTSQGSKIKATFLKVPAHGGSYSSRNFFINKVKPKVSVIMVGKNNKYGNPSVKVIERLKKIGSKLYRTDLNGTIYVTTDGLSYNVNPEKETPDAAILAQTYKAKQGVEDSGNIHVKKKLININKATASELVAIPSLGAFKAQMIIRYRNKHGQFNTIDDLLKVPGINKAVLKKIKDKIILN